MFRHRFFSILLLIATCLHAYELYAKPSEQDDVVRDLIAKNDTEQLKKIAPSLSKKNRALALEQIFLQEKPVETLAVLIPYATQDELDKIFFCSANGSRQDILTYMIQSGITIGTKAQDLALRAAIDRQSFDTITVDLLYPHITKTNISLKFAAGLGDIVLVQKLAARADNFDEALSEAIRQRRVTRIIQKSFHQPQSTPAYDHVIAFLSNLTNDFNKPLIAACHVNDQHTFANLLPKCADPSAALIEVTKYCPLSYVRSILSKPGYAPSPETIHSMVLNAARYSSDPEKSQLLDEYLTKVIDPIILTTIFTMFPEKKKLIPPEHLKSIEFFSSFRGGNWVEKLVSHSSSSAHEDTITSTLLKKYKADTNDETLTDFCQELGLDQLKMIGAISKLDSAVSQVSAIEKDDTKNGYTTFVHGRNWEWNFVNDVFNIITALKEDQAEIPETISMRQRDTNCDRSLLLAYRKKLIEQGVQGDHLTSSTNDDTSLDDHPERSEVTFMNYIGRPHLDYLPECSMRYFLENHSVTGSYPGYDFAEELIKEHGLRDYQWLFDDLFKAHQVSSNHGELLTISVANKHLDDIVYPAVPGGHKMDTYATTRTTIEDLKKRIFQPGPITMMRGVPIFCAAALNIPGEDESMYKIRSVKLPDTAKYEQYLAQRDALFKKLKKNLTPVDHHRYLQAFDF